MMGRPAAVPRKGIKSTIDTVSNKGPRLLALLLLWSLGLLPVYLFPSGGYQLADLPLMIMVFAALLYRTERSPFSTYFVGIAAFLAWVFMINSLQYIGRGDIWAVKATAVLIYGPALAYAFAKAFKVLLGRGLIRYAYYGLLASIFACLFAKGVDEAGRATLSFNDPNQLGYFAAVLQGFVLILRGYRKAAGIEASWFGLSEAVIVLFAHSFLALSFSRSAMAAFVILDVYLLKTMITEPKASLGFWIVLMALPLYFALIDAEFIQRRLEVRPHHFESHVFIEDLKERVIKPLRNMKGLSFVTGTGAGLGYQGEDEITITVVEAPEKAQEVLADIFNSSRPATWQTQGSIEAHNLIVDLLRSYGIIGLIFFLPWLLKMIWDSRGVPGALWVWMALLTYNMGNNGIRFRSFWILISLILAIEDLRKRYEQ